MALQKITTNNQGGFFTVVAYETADVSNKEQIVVCIRWVDLHFTVHEDFVVRTTDDEKVGVIKVRFLCDQDEKLFTLYL